MKLLRIDSSARLRHILEFIGLTDISFIHAENQKPGELAEPSRKAALEQLEQAVAALGLLLAAFDLARLAGEASSSRFLVGSSR